MNLVLDHYCDSGVHDYDHEGHEGNPHHSFTYIMMGNLIEPVGVGDIHDRNFDHMEMATSFDGLENIGDGTELGMLFNQDECQYTLSVYPTQDYYDEYHTNTPEIMAVVVACVSEPWLIGHE
jgi:hypothetical protein